MQGEAGGSIGNPRPPPIQSPNLPLPSAPEDPLWGPALLRGADVLSACALRVQVGPRVWQGQPPRAWQLQPGAARPCFLVEGDQGNRRPVAAACVSPSAGFAQGAGPSSWTTAAEKPQGWREPGSLPNLPGSGHAISLLKLGGSCHGPGRSDWT